MTNNTSIAFDRAADFYDQTRGFPPGEEAHIGALIANVGKLTKETRVLEIGVGTGRIALPVAPYVGAYYGIDLAVPMMARLLAKRTDEPIFVAQADATRLPFAAGTFDAIIAAHIFHLIPNWQEALNEVRRVLRPDGVLIHGWNGRDQIIDIEAALEAALPEKDRVVRIGAISKMMFEDTGWQRRVEQVHEFTRVQKPIEVIEQMRARVWSRCWRMTDEQLDAAVNALQAALSARYHDLHEPVEVTNSFHAVIYTPS